MGRRSRVASGVAVVAVMAKPYPCPHGRCIYCPGGGELPQSYVDASPVVVRAEKVGYDPYKQVWMRLKQIEGMGFKPSKVELIIMGGTFTATPLEYQEWFVKSCFDAMNDYPNGSDGNVRSSSLEEAHLRNENAEARCVALTIETRPDWAKEDHIDNMLRLGATRVEIGVQSIYEDVLRIIERGHTIEDVIEATRLLKDAGFKVCYHLMPGLPGSDYDRDLEMFRRVFRESHFMPDMLKIYPTLVVEGTKLYEMWLRSEYKPLEEDEAIELLIEAYQYMPRWVRIQHVQRDIPASYIKAGVRRRNLRQIVEMEIEKRGLKNPDIRYREVGHAVSRGIKPNYDAVEILRTDYEANEGTEIFLSAEDLENDVLIGVLRLRIPSEKAHRWEVDSSTAMIREIHVYGLQVPVGEEPKGEAQHRGFGRTLLKEAERIATEEFDRRKILVISGVGARQYFRKFGYKKLNGSFYMMKTIEQI